MIILQNYIEISDPDQKRILINRKDVTLFIKFLYLFFKENANNYNNDVQHL